MLDLNPEELLEKKPKGPKALAAAYELAAEQHDLDYFKEILTAFMQAREADQAAKEALKAEKQQAKKTPVKKEKKSAAKAVEDDDADLEMADVIGDAESDGADAAVEPAKTKKRKAEDVS